MQAHARRAELARQQSEQGCDGIIAATRLHAIHTLQWHAVHERNPVADPHALPDADAEHRPGLEFHRPGLKPQLDKRLAIPQLGAQGGHSSVRVARAIWSRCVQD
eukprot:2234014-Prymnesium_polylepis.1